MVFLFEGPACAYLPVGDAQIVEDDRESEELAPEFRFRADSFPFR
jgi:hypothetical protein